MAERARQRAVLIGKDSARLLTLAVELKARGLEVAVYRDSERGLAECSQDRCAVLVALGRTPTGSAEPAARLAVPLVLIDVPDAPTLPVRPQGPRTVLGPTVPAETVADRVLALLAPRQAIEAAPRAEPASAVASRRPAVAAEPAEPSGRTEPTPPRRAAPASEPTDQAAQHGPATAQSDSDSWSDTMPSRRSQRRRATVLRWVAIVVIGVALGFLVGMAWLNSAMGR